MFKTNPTLVSDLDYFISSMNREMAKKITISLIADKLEIHYEIAKQLILYYEQCGILERRFSITCPLCGQIIKTVKEIDLFDTLDDLNEFPFCIGCEDESFTVTAENVFILFERKKTSTSSQDEINKTLEQRNVIRSIPRNDNFFNQADLLDTDDICELYYKPDESAYNELMNLFNALDDVYPNTVEQGAAYDKLAKRIFSCVKGIDTTNKLKTDTNQIDGFSLTYMKTIFPSIFDILTPVFYFECKNEPDNAPGISYYQKLYAIINKSRVAKVGIIFSRKKATREALIFGKQMYLVNGTVLINIYDADWKLLIEKRVNILKFIHIKYSEILSYAKENIDLVNEFIQ